METMTPETKTVQKINFIEGLFTASEAQDILMAVLDKKINFHKIKRLSITEGNAHDHCHYDTSRIDQLVKEKEIAQAFFERVRTEGTLLEINSTIEITVKNK